MTGGRGLGRYLILTETTAHFILRPGVEYLWHAKFYSPAK